MLCGCSGGGGGGGSGGGGGGLQLFVAGIPFMMRERDVHEKFDRCGAVRDVRIMKHRETGESRGE